MEKRVILKLDVKTNVSSILPKKLNPFNLFYYSEIASKRDSDIIQRWKDYELKISDRIDRIVFISKKEILDMLEDYFRNEIDDKEILFLISLYRKRYNILHYGNEDVFELLPGKVINELMVNDYVIWNIFNIRKIVRIFDINDVNPGLLKENLIKFIELGLDVDFRFDDSISKFIEKDNVDKYDVEDLITNIDENIINRDLFYRIWENSLNN